MQRDYAPRFTMDELVDATGLPARTIRYYIQKGLAPRAHGKGRSAYYTAGHVETLTRIRELRADNLSTDEIRRMLEEPDQPPAVEIAGDAWNRVVLHPDLEVHTRANAPEHILVLARQIQRLTEEWLGDQRDVR